MKEELEFYERQRFNKWLIIPLILVVNVPLIYGCITQLGMEKPCGNNPASDTMLIVVTILSTLLTVSFFFIYVDTMINEEGVWVRSFPFNLRFKFTPWGDISEFVVRKLIGYKRGISYKLAPKRVGNMGIQMATCKTYNLSGNYLLELTLKNNKKIIIGTRQPAELTEFLDKLDAKRKQK